MRFETLLLADNAAAIEGKLYIHGGGITRLTPPQLPWPHPLLTFLVRLRADGAADLTAEHQLRLGMVDPDGEFVVPASELLLRHDEQLSVIDGELLYANVAITVAPLLLMREGVHTVQV